MVGSLGIAVAEFAAPYVIHAVLPHTAAQIIGVAEVAFSLARLSSTIEKLASRTGDDAVDEMLSLMRSRVPQDTGRLLNGIVSYREQDVIVVEASAVRVTQSGKESADYAAFVEYGTRAGERGGRVSYVADEDFFNLSTRPGSGRTYKRTRRVYRQHPGTPAQPFFWNSAEEALEHRYHAAAQGILDAARDEGWS